MKSLISTVLLFSQIAMASNSYGSGNVTGAEKQEILKALKRDASIDAVKKEYEAIGAVCVLKLKSVVKVSEYRSEFRGQLSCDAPPRAAEQGNAAFIEISGTYSYKIDEITLKISHFMA